MTNIHTKSHSEKAEAARLRALLESAVDGIVTIDERGNIDTVNPATERLFQYREDELLGRNVKMLMPEPYRSEHDGYLSRYCRTGERKIIGIGREVTGQRKDGTTFPMHLSVSQFDSDGEIFFTGIIRDLSAQKRAEEALSHSQKLEAIGHLTGGIAHDFNNLLTVIIGNLELLDMKLDDPKQIELLREASEAADLGAKLTERLLAFARRSALEPDVINLNSLVLSLTDLLHRTLGETIDLSTSLSTSLWNARVDPGQIESAIVNLAVNARDAMPDGGKLIIETRNIHIDEFHVIAEGGLQVGDYVQLSVSDTGSGMPDDVLRRAFEPFFTTKKAGRGTGLGLSMVYGFAKQSGGHVTIYSEVGRGTSINIYLPRHGGAVDAIEEARNQRNGSPVSERILVVEDDSRVRRLTSLRLSELGYQVIEAASGPEALEILEREPSVALLFTDLVMPGGMSGHELCAEVVNRRPEVKLLLTSGYSDAFLKDSLLPGRRPALLRKPYMQAALAEAVREALAGD